MRVTLQNLLPPFGEWTLSGAVTEGDVLHLPAGAIGSWVSQSAGPVAIEPEHTYYLSLRQMGSFNDLSQILWREWFSDGYHSPLGLRIDIGAHDTWYRQSAIGTAAGFRQESPSFEVNCRSVTTEAWLCDMMLIDLTAAFGSGAEPSQAWCDANIPTIPGGGP